jgi:biotin transport system substrate-specific component
MYSRISAAIGTVGSSYNALNVLYRILLGCVFLSLCAYIRIPLPFTPIVLTGQTFATMFLGATMGSRIGLATVGVYLAQGCMNLPIFASGLGLNALCGLHGGYILGFLIQVYLVGKLLESRPQATPMRIFSILMASCVIQLSMGTLWLASFVGFASAIGLGFIPFIVGEFVKSGVLTLYLTKSRKS